MDEFAAELATLRGRVDALEARASKLEAQQFSTTTKLQGEALIAVQYGETTGNFFGDSGVPFTSPADRPFPNTGGLRNQRNQDRTTYPGGEGQPTMLARVRLSFNTSFNGTDLLQTQLEAGNAGQDLFSALGFNSNPLRITQGSLGPSGIYGNAGNPPLVDWGAADYANVPNTFYLRRLAYTFKPADNLALTFGPRLFPSDFIDFNSYANNSAQDFTSGFFINNALIITNGIDVLGGAGGAVDWNVGGGPISVRAVYVAASAQSAVFGGNSFYNRYDGDLGGFGGGLFGDPFQASAEFEYADTFGSRDQNNFAVRLQYTYANTFEVKTNAVGANVEATFGRFGVFGRVGYGFDNQAYGQSISVLNDAGNIQTLNGVSADGFEYDALTWMAGVGYKDLFIPGSLLAAAVGQPFIDINNSFNFPSTQTNIEGFYRFAVNDNISVTPTVMVILDGFNNLTGNNDAVIQGLIRTTFSF